LGVHALTAVQAAVADAGLRPDDVDGLATYPDAPFIGAGHRDGVDLVSVEYLARRLATRTVSWSAELSSGMVVSAVSAAATALMAGLCRYAVVWRAMHVPAGGYGRLSGQPEARGEAQFSAPWRIVSPVQWHALAYRRYLERYGADRTRMAALAVTSREYATRNEHACFRDRPLTTEAYLDSRIVSDPLAVHDCDVPVQTCIAVVLTTAERAAHAPSAAYVAGVAANTPTSPPRLHYTFDDHIERGSTVARELWDRSGLRAADMSAAQLYDGFAPSAIYWLEAAGFCGPGEGLDFIQDGRIGPDGELPLNTFGGSLSAGRTHGMGHIAESALQVTGRAGPRQLAEADAVCVFAGSPMLDGGALVLTRERQE
jgi:acetyl-CoA acetyltransferase